MVPRSATARPSGPVASGRNPPLYRRAFVILAHEIVGGDLSAETRLHESRVAERFGISRAPARQALSLLEANGLVGRHPTGGYSVLDNARGKAVSGLEQDPGTDSTLSSQPSWQQIYNEVESEIVARISFGEWRVKEAELARYHGVSRTVARDVMGRLQQRGLVRQDDRSRWFAPALTPTRINELYEIRWHLEPLALERATAHLPGTVINEAIARLELAIADPSGVTGATLDALEMELHSTILSYCQNQSLMTAIRLQQSLLIAHRFLYRWTREMFWDEPFLPEHTCVLERVQGGQAAEAAAELERHLRTSAARAIARVEAVTAKFHPEGLPYLIAGDRGPN